jgi:hypothetical protein
VPARKAAAVVIGVDKTGGFDPLKSAASGAKQVAAWLEKEKFDVACLTDGPATPVTANGISTAIATFATKPPTYDLLVVYFSGHGQWHTRADHWLLSGAPANTAEAINLEGAMYTARKCGIPNVVFISDACRTIPRTDVDSLVGGVDAFPNHGITSTAKIDYFKATSDARAAWELPIKGTDQSVLTHVLLDAFEAPEPHIVKQLGNGDQAIYVVPNRLLESVLQPRVDAILDEVEGDLAQIIETSVPSADDVYIARVWQKDGSGKGGAAPPPPPLPRAPGGDLLLGDDWHTRSPSFDAKRRPSRKVPGRAAAEAISNTLRGAAGAMAPTGVNSAEIDRRTPDPAADHFETETGFIIRGAHVVDAAISPHARSGYDVLNAAGDPRGEAVRINPGVPAQSVVIVLGDGRSVVLPALKGYLAHAIFDEDGLANVSYVPSSNNWRWYAYNANRQEIDRLRALVALAVQRNTFRVRSELEAIQLAQRIRVEKALDPTLGLYAAYAFAQAGIDGQVRDIAGYMREDLNADLFDVAMLAGYTENPPAYTQPPVPFCPMLTQGWNLLRAYDVTLPDVLTTASRHLCNSLWSTFTKRGTSLVLDAIRSGALQ